MKLYTRKDVEEKNGKARNSGEPKRGAAGTDAPGERTKAIVRGLGGLSNISDVDCCATRLRCTVLDAGKVDEGLLKSTGASGVIKKGQGVQIIYGPGVTVIKSDLEEYMDRGENTGHEREPGREENTGYGKNPGRAETVGKVCRTVVIGSPMTGMAAPLSEAPDEGFAAGMMGQGAIITPADPIVRAPADGTVSFVFPTRHALGLTTKEGLSLLIHVGIDTVKLKGNGFKVMVQEGDQVKRGDAIMRLNLDFIKSHAPSLASPVLFPELSDSQRVRLLSQGTVKAGEDFLAVDEFLAVKSAKEEKRGENS